jgi:hypothetical protein
MTDANPRDLIQRLADAYAYCIDEYMTASSEEDALIVKARAYLAQPEPEGPTDEELLFTFYEASLAEGGDTDEVTLRGLRAVLARWGK